MSVCQSAYLITRSPQVSTSHNAIGDPPTYDGQTSQKTLPSHNLFGIDSKDH